MIRTDGDRSRKRLWLAKKKLSVLDSLDLPVNCIKYDGFTIKTWRQDELTGGSITAPMGAVISISNESGTKLFVAENWQGAITAYSDLYSLYYSVTEGQVVVVINGATEEEMVEAGYSTLKFRPMVSLSPFGLVDGETTYAGTVWEKDHSCQPLIMPYKAAEAFTVTVSDNVFIDLNNNGTADFPKTITESSVVFYSANGSNLGGRMTMALETDDNFDQPWRIWQQLDADTLLQFQFKYYDAEESRLIAGRLFQFHVTSAIYLDELIAEDHEIPNGLRSIILDTSAGTSIYPIGSFSFIIDGVQTYLHVVNCTNTIPWSGSFPAQDWFDDYPADEKWKLFYCMSVGGSTTIINSDQFIGLLDSLATVSIIGGSIDWNNARRMLSQLVGYPHGNFLNPYDSVMFAGHDGNVYSWTREYGAVKFTQIGLFSAPEIVVPFAVTNEEGVRPEIYYCGTVDEIPLYVCICNKPKESIRDISIGSPFDSWVSLEAINSEYALVHARVTNIIGSSVFMIGICKRVIDPAYFFCCFDGTKWNVMSQIPAEITENDNFQASLFGDGQQVNGLLTLPIHPPCVPQMPLGPYDKYSIGMP